MSIKELPPLEPVKPVEMLGVVVICFGWFIVSSVQAVAAGFPSGGAFDDTALFALIVMELVFTGAALAFLRARGYPIGSLKCQPSWKGCLSGLALFGAAMLAWWMVSIAFFSGDMAPQPIDVMVAQSKASIAMVLAVSLVNGLFEETFLLGYMARGLRSHGFSIAIGISLLVRVLYHLYQGPVGAVSVLVFGLVLSLFYWRSGKLWPVVCAHAVADVAGLAS